MSSAAERLSAENAELAKQRDYARDELAKYRSQAQELGNQLKGFKERAITLGGGSITLTAEGALALDQDFAFNSGSATVNEAGQRVIRELANLLNSSEYAGTKVIIEGHLTAHPSAEPAPRNNLLITGACQRCALPQSFVSWKKSGVTADRLHGAFAGQHSPAVSGKSKEAKAANRRVNIFVTL